MFLEADLPCVMISKFHGPFRVYWLVRRGMGVSMTLVLVNGI